MNEGSDIKPRYRYLELEDRAVKEVGCPTPAHILYDNSRTAVLYMTPDMFKAEARCSYWKRIVTARMKVIRARDR